MAIRSLIRERFFPHLWCPGCGHGHVLNAMLHSVDDLGYDPSSLVMVSGIGWFGPHSGVRGLSRRQQRFKSAWGRQKFQ